MLRAAVFMLLVGGVVLAQPLPVNQLPMRPTKTGQKLVADKLKELDDFRLTDDFKTKGVGKASKQYGWIERLQSTRAEAMKQKTCSYEEWGALCDIEGMTYDYLRTRGQDTKNTIRAREGIEKVLRMKAD